MFTAYGVKIASARCRQQQRRGFGTRTSHDFFLSSILENLSIFRNLFWKRVLSQSELPFAPARSIEFYCKSIPLKKTLPLAFRRLPRGWRRRILKFFRSAAFRWCGYNCFKFNLWIHCTRYSTHLGEVYGPKRRCELSIHFEALCWHAPESRSNTFEQHCWGKQRVCWSFTADL